MRRGALAILAFGVALRLVRYFADRSLWLDESLLTINLMTRSYRASRNSITTKELGRVPLD